MNKNAVYHKGVKNMNIKILGGGCKKCDALFENVKSAIEELNIDADIEKVSDMADIMKYGVMSTPAIVVDEEVKSTGRVMTAKEITKILS
jgi:small redox-active disulfide protein 2